MPLGNWNVEWLNQNSQRAYPLADDATATDNTGSFEIPTDFIVELYLPVHSGMDVDPARFFVLNIGAYATGYSVIVGYQPADTTQAAVPVASALIPRQVQTRNTTYALGGVAPFDDTVGKIVIGRLDNIDQQPPGFWTFTLDSTRLDPDAVRPIIRGVSSITCVNGDQASAPLYGDIELQAGANMQIVPVIVSGQDPLIIFNAINGEGTVEQCICVGDAASAGPILTINGIPPTAAGDWTLAGSACIQVEPMANGVRLTDTCAQPCCGPTELEAITRDLERLGAQAQAVQNFVDTLQQAVTAMDLTVLGARLSDRGCISC